MMTLGQLLKGTREARGLSAAEVALATGHSPSWLSDWELDKKSGPMPPYEMTQLSRMLGLPMRELLTASGYDLGDDAAVPVRPAERQIREIAATLTDWQLENMLRIVTGALAMMRGED